MASNKTIVVLTPKGRRQNVKVTPNTTILQILEEVCKKHGFNSQDYDVKHHNTVLDTSTLVQFSGLPNNAQLEMIQAVKIRSESTVTLGVQLETGERLMGTFSPSKSLWDIINDLCPKETQSDDLVVIYMRREVYGKSSLEETTLRELGLTGGRAMVRLIHRKPEELKIQANVSTPLVAKPVEEKPFKRTLVTSHESIINPSVTDTITTNVSDIEMKTIVDDKDESEVKIRKESEKSPTHTESFSSVKKSQSEKVTRKGDEDRKPEPVRTTTSNDEVVFISKHKRSLCPHCGCTLRKHRMNINKRLLFDLPLDVIEKQLGERNALAFTLEMADSLPHEDLPDEFFDLTVNDARTLLNDLKQRRTEMENAPLQTEQYRNLEREKKVLNNLNKYKRSVLRILFPDRTVLQGTFKSTETVQVVMNFVKDYLDNPNLDFHLYTTPPKEILKPSARLIETECVPCAVLHFGLSTPSEVHSYLKKDLLTKFSSYSAASLVASKSRGIALKENTDVSNFPTTSDSTDFKTYPSSAGAVSRTTASSRKSTPDSDKKFPKWFKPV